jgi:hypothetical protein
MGAMKEVAENVSVAMGGDGQITDEVLVAADNMYFGGQLQSDGSDARRPFLTSQGPDPGEVEDDDLDIDDEDDDDLGDEDDDLDIEDDLLDDEDDDLEDEDDEDDLLDDEDDEVA